MSNDNLSTDNKQDILGFMKDHIRRYLASNGEDGHLMNGNPCLILTTTGAKSGKERQAAVIYGKRGNDYIIVASKGGSDTPPAWFINLQTHPQARIQVKADVHDVRMRVAKGEERQALWEMMTKIFPDYLDYQSKTDRQIAVCVLEII
jgi:deazaflavin-dependent oxidoreductase (nitroreductase family)